MSKVKRSALAAAAGDNGDPTRDPVEGPPELKFRIPALIMEGLETSDSRIIEAGALAPRPLPLGLAAMRVNPEFGGHGLAFVCGHIDSMTRVSATGWVNPLGGTYGPDVFAWTAEGYFNDDEDGRWVAARVEDGSLRYVSGDLAGVESEIEVTEVDEDGWPLDGIERTTAGEIVGATVCNGSAFAGCYIELVNADEAPAEGEEAEPVPEPVTASGLRYLVEEAPTRLDVQNSRIINDGPGCAPCRAGLEPVEGLVAAGGPLHPPAAWFTASLTEPTPITITDDGRVYGHLALWGTCHLQFADKCVTPPASPTNYAAGFHTGAVRVAEGEDLAVGHLTMKTGHPSLALSTSDTVAHYDNTGAVWADVRAGEDDYGIWIAGALVPDLSDHDLRMARSASLSGDWRRIGTGLELVAALSVNTPGFPVPRALAASGVTTALVAAGAAAVPTEPLSAPLSAMELVTLRMARDLALSRLPKPKTLTERRADALAKLGR